MKTREELAIIRAKCDNDLLFFTRFFYKELRGSKFVVNDHHIELCRHFQDVSDYKVKLLNINIPPRHSKTELAINFIARGIGMNPSSNWLYISASDELRSETSIRIRDIITHPYFKIMYNVEIKKDQNNKNLWRTKQGGGLKTATIFGQVTGFGAGMITEKGFKVNKDTEDLIREFEGSQVWDDLNKTEDSEAENANNDKVSRVIFNTLLSRENSHDTPIVHIQQRTGMTDATASLIEHYGTQDDKYRFIVMPIIKNGVPLWEAKYPIEEIQKLKTSPKTAHVFDTQYMQDPKPSKGVVFTRDNTQSFKLSDLNREQKESSLGAIDVADKGIDYLSFPIGEIYGDKIYITDWVFSQENMEYTIPKCSSVISSQKLNYVAVETNNHGHAFIRELYNNVGSSGIIAVNQSTNKHSRIINEAQFIRMYFVFRSDYEIGSDYDKAMKLLFQYRKDGTFKKDDAPDSLALLALLARDLFQDRFL